MLAYCIKDGKDQDADEFLGFYLDALDEELIELNIYIDMRKVLKLEKPGEEAQSTEGRTEVRERDGTVRQLFLFPLH